MGKLIILSGPSCVGKGPLIKTLEIYLKTINKTLKRHVLYNTRNKKADEKHGKTYLYSYLWDKNDWYQNINAVTYDSDKAASNMILIMKDAIKKAGTAQRSFEIFAVREDLQGLNYAELNKDLNSNDIVLLEIYKDKVDDVITFCKKNGHAVKRVFISPLSDEDYEKENCFTKAERDSLTEKTMRKKLERRGRDSQESIVGRIATAIKEVNEAREMKDNDVNFIYFVNHFGEDMKEDWEELQKSVGKAPKYYEYGQNYTFSLAGEIDKTFRQFLEQVFPEIPEHTCGKDLNGCSCWICGRRHHSTKITEGNYGSGCGSVVDTCVRCGAWERWDDATGKTLARSDDW